MAKPTELVQVPPLSSTTCNDLSPADRAQLYEAAQALLNAGGMLVRLSDFLGSRLEHLAGGSARRAVQKVEQRLRGPIERALWHGYRLATLRLDRGERVAWSRSKKLAATASGAMAGMIGMPGLALDLPFTTAMMLRSIAEIARSYGEDPRDPRTRQACIEVFTLGTVPGEKSDVELSYWTSRAALNQATVTMTIQQAARLLAVPLSEKLLAQAIPVAGAVAGGTLNYAFIDYYQQIARVHFAVRALERRTGNTQAIRTCLHEAVQALRARQ